jgi:hypothetical protein
MSAPHPSVDLRPNRLMRYEARPLAFDKKSVSPLAVVPSRSLPVRVVSAVTSPNESIPMATHFSLDCRSPSQARFTRKQLAGSVQF